MLPTRGPTYAMQAAWLRVALVALVAVSRLEMGLQDAMYTNANICVYIGVWVADM